MTAIPIDAALFGLIAVAALAFCLGFVASSVMNMRTIRDVQAAPRSDPTITATGRTGRWEAADQRARLAALAATPANRYRTQPLPGQIILVDEDDAFPKLCACGYLRCLCQGSAAQ